MQVTGTIFDLKKFAIHDGPGIRTTVFFKGCPLECAWCHNPEGVRAFPETLTLRSGTDSGNDSGSIPAKKEEVVGRMVTVEEVMDEIEKDVIFYEQSGGGATFSGGEPLLQEDFLSALLEECRERRIHTAVDTCGFAPWETIEKIAGLTDLFLYDLKIIDENAHEKYAGEINDLILENLKKLSAVFKNIIIRVPLIPGITDTDSNLEQVAGFLEPLEQIREVDLLPYNKLSEDKFRRIQKTPRGGMGQLPTQTEEDLIKKANLFRSRGYEVKIGG